MQAYFDTVTDRFGNSLAGATVTVRAYPSATLATLFSDPAGTVPLTNPIVTDANGDFQFFAANSQYSLTIVAQGTTATPTRYVTLFDPGATDFQVYLNGGTYHVPAGIARTVNSSLATIASFNVVLPATPIDGQAYVLCSQATITTLSVAPGAGQSIDYPPTTISGGTSMSWVYQLSQLTWCRLT